MPQYGGTSLKYMHLRCSTRRSWLRPFCGGSWTHLVSAACGCEPQLLKVRATVMAENAPPSGTLYIMLRYIIQ